MNRTTRYYKDWKATDIRARVEYNEDWGGPGDRTFAVLFELPDGTQAVINEIGNWYAPAEDGCLVFDGTPEDETGIRDETNLRLHISFSKEFSLGDWDEATQSFAVTGPDARVILNE